MSERYQLVVPSRAAAGRWPDGSASHALRPGTSIRRTSGMRQCVTVTRNTYLTMSLTGGNPRLSFVCGGFWSVNQFASRLSAMQII